MIETFENWELVKELDTYPDLYPNWHPEVEPEIITQETVDRVKHVLQKIYDHGFTDIGYIRPEITGGVDIHFGLDKEISITINVENSILTPKDWNFEISFWIWSDNPGDEKYRMGINSQKYHFYDDKELNKFLLLLENVFNAYTLLEEDRSLAKLYKLASSNKL